MAMYMLDTLPDVEEVLDAAVNDIVLIEVTRETFRDIAPRFVVSVSSHDRGYSDMRCFPSYRMAKRAYRRQRGLTI